MTEAGTNLWTGGIFIKDNELREEQFLNDCIDDLIKFMDSDVRDMVTEKEKAEMEEILGEGTEDLWKDIYREDNVHTDVMDIEEEPEPLWKGMEQVMRELDEEDMLIKKMDRYDRMLSDEAEEMEREEEERRRWYDD